MQGEDTLLAGLPPTDASREEWQAALLERIGPAPLDSFHIHFCQVLATVAPTEYLPAWAHSRDRLRAVAASCERTPLADLTTLARDLSHIVRTLLAGNPAIDSGIVDVLAVDKVVDVRAALAGNPATPTHMLARLSTDVNPSVRYAVATHDRCPLDARLQLGLDNSVSVRQAVFFSSTTPLSVVVLFAGREPARNWQYGGAVGALAQRVDALLKAAPGGEQVPVSLVCSALMRSRAVDADLVRIVECYLLMTPAARSMFASLLSSLPVDVPWLDVADTAREATTLRAPARRDPTSPGPARSH